EGAKELLRISEAMLLDTEDMRREEDDQREGERCIEIRRGDGEEGHDAEQVREEDHERGGADEREKDLRRILTHHRGHLIVDVTREELDNGADGEFPLGDNRSLRILDLGIGANPEEEEH